jgi:hypothetical protein
MVPGDIQLDVEAYDPNFSHVMCVDSEGGATAPYRLLTGFPPAELTDFGRTIEAAGLKSARITQKLV